MVSLLLASSSLLLVVPLVVVNVVGNVLSVMTVQLLLPPSDVVGMPESGRDS